MLLLWFSFKDIQDNITLILGCLKLKFFLWLEFDGNHLFLTWLEFSLHRINRENFTGYLFLHAEVELYWVHTIVFKCELLLFRFTNSHSFEIEHWLIIINFDINSDFKSFSAQLDGLRVLLYVVTLGIFNFKSNFRLEFLLFLCTEGNFNNFILAWFDNAWCLRDGEFLWKAFNATQLPLDWDGTNIL